MRVDGAAFLYLGRGKFWRALWEEINEDDCWGMAAQLSYYFLLAFFPFLLFLSALIGFIPVASNLLSHFIVELNKFLPTQTAQFVQEILSDLVHNRNQGVLTAGFALSLWSASMAFNGMVSLFNSAYEVKETRSYFQTRSLSILVTIIVSAFVLSSGVLLFFGDRLIDLLAMGGTVRLLYGVLRWGLIFFLLNIGIQIVYFTLPARRLPWKVLSPGSCFATLGWIFGSLGFRFYVNHYGNFQLLYGSLGALIILMVWFYICSLFLIVGGELDSEVYKMRREEGIA